MNPPNVVVIMSDQHQAGVMGCAGDPIARTPSLDGLASKGVRFENAYCSFPLCGPSRMSFMTGLQPHEINQWDNACELDSSTPTFTHAFDAAGYQTLLAGRMHFVGEDQRHGFSQRLIGDVSPTAFITAGWRLEEVLGDLVDTPGMSLRGIEKSGPGITGYQAYDQAVTETSIDWIRQRGESSTQEPFLLTIGYVSPHCPFVAPPEEFNFYKDKVSESDLPTASGDLHPRNQSLREAWKVSPPPSKEAQWRTRVAYYGLTTFLDRQVGSVLQALEDSGLSDNTIIVYCSDHGEALGDHGMWWKSSFYDSACRVPLIISYPGRMDSGKVCTSPVSLMDIFPTLTDLCSIDCPEDVSGHSLRKVIQGKGGEERPVFAEDTLGTVCRMVRLGPWKYNTYLGMKPELFNLRDDPGEENNLSGQGIHAEVEEKLKTLVLTDWDPMDIQGRIQDWQREKGRIAEQLRTKPPPEPDPPWFESTPENFVDQSIRPKDTQS